MMSFVSGPLGKSASVCLGCGMGGIADAGDDSGGGLLQDALHMTLANASVGSGDEAS